MAPYPRQVPFLLLYSQTTPMQLPLTPGRQSSSTPFSIRFLQVALSPYPTRVLFIGTCLRHVCAPYHYHSSLDPTKSSGCDSIGPKLIKHCALALYVPLHHHFSVSLSKQCIPIEWKYHSVTPIFKSEDKSQVENYYHSVSCPKFLNILSSKN